MPLKLNSTGGGSVTLDVGSTASNTTLTLPSTSGTVIAGTNGIAPESSGGTGTTTGYYGFKNRIINGAMMIDQRNAGASVTPTDAQYTLDRWAFRLSQASKFTVQQNAGAVTPPSGFTNYLGVTSSSAYSVLSSDYFALYQTIEGFNTADFGWGTASASTVTLSFWVRSSLTGTFGGSIRNPSVNRAYPFSYTISSANTWEYKTITVPGDTVATWATNNTGGPQVFWGLGVGSNLSGTAGAWSSAAGYVSVTGATSVVGTNGATFYITGVQLEKGSTDTSFDYRPYGTELALCQRYCRVIRTVAYQKISIGTVGNSTQVNATMIPIGTPMRATPSLSFSGTTVVLQGASAWALTSIANLSSKESICFDAVASGATMTTGYAGMVGADSGGTCVLTISAEL